MSSCQKRPCGISGAMISELNKRKSAMKILYFPVKRRRFRGRGRASVTTYSRDLCSEAWYLQHIHGADRILRAVSD
jgi:hypothetical protein